MGKAPHPGVINVRNTGEEEERDLIASDLMFYSTNRFTTVFTEALEEQYKHLRTISVFTDFELLGDEPIV